MMMTMMIMMMVMMTTMMIMMMIMMTIIMIMMIMIMMIMMMMMVMMMTIMMIMTMMMTMINGYLYKKNWNKINVTFVQQSDDDLEQKKIFHVENVSESCDKITYRA